MTLPPLPGDIDVRLGARAVALDLPTRTVGLSDGTDLRDDGLVVATGSRPRRLAAAGQEGGLVVRTLADAAATAAAVHRRMPVVRLRRLARSAVRGS